MNECLLYGCLSIVFNVKLGLLWVVNVNLVNKLEKRFETLLLVEYYELKAFALSFVVNPSGMIMT